MGSFVIRAPVKVLTDEGGNKREVPDVDFEFEGVVKLPVAGKGILTALMGAKPDELSWWAVNGAKATQTAINTEVVKGREAFEGGKPDNASNLEKALDISHRFAGEIRKGDGAEVAPT